MITVVQLRNTSINILIMKKTNVQVYMLRSAKDNVKSVFYKINLTPPIKKNYQKSGNFPILMKCSVLIYQGRNFIMHQLFYFKTF